MIYSKKISTQKKILPLCPYLNVKFFKKKKNMEKEGWKLLASKRSKDNNIKSHRLKEMTESRNNWREKYLAQKKENTELQKQINAIKKKLNLPNWL
jgi:hypothetical protein